MTHMKGKKIALWAVQIAAAAMFLMAGTLKLTGTPQMVALFQAIGLGQWFRFLTGSFEVVGGVALLIPGVAVLGALALPSAALHRLELLSRVLHVKWFHERLCRVVPPQQPCVDTGLAIGLDCDHPIVVRSVPLRELPSEDLRVEGDRLVVVVHG